MTGRAGPDLAGVRKILRSVRESLPRPVVSFLRWALTVWGRVTAPWRMTPAFIIVGAQRTGTTTLFRLLSEHPAVTRPTVNKGIGYFDLEHDRGWRWYRAHFPLARGRNRHRMAFESSGYYLFHPLAASRMARDLPEVRVVVLVRDPVERAYSAHRHELARGFETEPFERAVELEPVRLAGEDARLRSEPGYRSEHHRHHAYLGRSEYAAQIQTYVDALGRDRVYVVDADRFFADPIAEYAALQEWLELPLHTPTHVDQWNARPRDPIDPALRQRLLEHFDTHDAALTALMGRVPSWRAGQTPEA